MDCPKCGAKSTDANSCSACGIIFAKYETSKSVFLKNERQKQFESLNPNQPLVWWIELGFPLFAFALAPALLWMFPSLTWASSMWIHEFGHAFAAWFGGMAATPFLGWTSLGQDRSWVVTICFTILLSLLAYKSWEKKSYFLVATFACMFLAQIYFRFGMPQSALIRTIQYMGIGGEFWISTWFVIAFHYSFPENTHWRMIRFPAAFIGAFTFYNIFHLWMSVSKGRRDIPWGSLWGDSGDMDALRDQWLWTPEHITSSYLTFGYVCVGLMLSHYMGQIIRQFFTGGKRSPATEATDFQPS